MQGTNPLRNRIRNSIICNNRQSSPLRVLRRHRSPCNTLRRTHHSQRDTTMTVMFATNLTISTTPRVQDRITLTVQFILVPVFRMEDKLDNRHITGRLCFSNPDTHRLPSGPGCNSSYSCSSTTWGHNAHSSATRTYTTSFDAKR